MIAQNLSPNQRVLFDIPSTWGGSIGGIVNTTVSAGSEFVLPFSGLYRVTCTLYINSNNANAFALFSSLGSFVENGTYGMQNVAGGVPVTFVSIYLCSSAGTESLSIRNPGVSNTTMFSPGIGDKTCEITIQYIGPA